MSQLETSPLFVTFLKLRSLHHVLYFSSSASLTAFNENMILRLRSYMSQTRGDKAVRMAYAWVTDTTRVTCIYFTRLPA